MEELGVVGWVRPVPFSLESWEAELGMLMKTRPWSHGAGERLTLRPHSMEGGPENPVKSSAASA